MKINEWGVFVERPDGSTHEIKMYYNSQDYDEKQLDYVIQLFDKVKVRIRDVCRGLELYFVK